MTKPLPEFSRGEFEQLLEEHQRLVGLANDVEFSLHLLASGANAENLHALQQSAGTLVRSLRNYLFRLDQDVLPVVDPSRSAARGG